MYVNEPREKYSYFIFLLIPSNYSSSFTHNSEQFKEFLIKSLCFCIKEKMKFVKQFRQCNPIYVQKREHANEEVDRKS
jgi:hypothetical protein